MKEAHALDVLHSGAHENLVSILRHGWLDSSCYFIDMELCDMNLDKFIFDNSNWNMFSCSNHPEYLSGENPPTWWRTAENLKIMFQLASGVTFIHRRDHVHRDLKPSNSTCPQI